MFIHTYCRFGQVYVKKLSLDTITYLRGYAGVLGGLRVWRDQGSEAVFNRLLQRCGRGLLNDKDIYDIIHFNTPAVKNQEVSFLDILNFRCIYIYFNNCLLTFATVIHKNLNLKTVNGGSAGINATCFSKGQKWKAGENTAVVCLAQVYRWSKTPLKRGVTFQTATTTEQQQRKLWLHWITLYSIWR